MIASAERRQFLTVEIADDIYTDFLKLLDIHRQDGAYVQESVKLEVGENRYFRRNELCKQCEQILYNLDNFNLTNRLKE